MTLTPKNDELWLYGPETVNVESKLIESREYRDLEKLRHHLLGMLDLHHGIGIAAPQIGVFKQMIVFERLDGSIMDLVNPQVARMYGRELFGFEACSCVPPFGNGCLVARIEHVELEYRTASSPNVTRYTRLSGRDAVVVQHELDHLTGTFFFERASRVAKKKVLEEYENWKKGKKKNAEDYTGQLAPHR